MKSIFVGNLSVSVTEEVLGSLFEAYGTVERVSIMTDRSTGKAKGFGFVDMSDDAEAVKATTALNGRDVEGRTLTVSEARPKTDRPGGVVALAGNGGNKRLGNGPTCGQETMEIEKGSTVAVVVKRAWAELHGVRMFLHQNPQAEIRGVDDSHVLFARRSMPKIPKACG